MRLRLTLKVLQKAESIIQNQLLKKTAHRTDRRACRQLAHNGRSALLSERFTGRSA